MFVGFSGSSVLLKGNLINFTPQSLFTGVGEYYCVCGGKKPVLSLLWLQGGLQESDKLPQVMSPESTSV